MTTTSRQVENHQLDQLLELTEREGLFLTTSEGDFRTTVSLTTDQEGECEKVELLDLFLENLD